MRSERWWEANMVGGSTMVWDGNFPRYTTEDFDVLPYLKGCQRGTHGEMAMELRGVSFLFSSARNMSGVCPATLLNRTNICGLDIEYPMPPLKPAYVHGVSDGHVYSSGTAALRRRARDQLANFRWPTRLSILRILPVLWLRRKLPIQFSKYRASSAR